MQDKLTSHAQACKAGRAIQGRHAGQGKMWVVTVVVTESTVDLSSGAGDETRMET